MMLDKIIEILNNRKDLSGWKILENKRESYELYYIRRDLEMNRGKNIHNINVTVYKEFDIDGKKYIGSSLTIIHPTMNENEIGNAIDEAAYASEFAKNQYYPLVKPSSDKIGKIESNLSSKPFDEMLNDIVNAVFKIDFYDKGSINSTEIFITKNNNRLINSKGIDVTYEKYEGVLEFITNWKEEKEEIELYKHIDFGNFDSEKITKEVEEMLEMSRGRAIAKSTPSLGNHNVILSGESVAKFFEYFYFQANANYVYEKYSTAKVDESIQGENILGDKINLKLNPFLPGSSKSSIYDDDGIVLKEVNIIENGVLKNYWGSQRHSYYLGVEPTGNILNYEVNEGSLSINELKKEPYLEVVSFSSFQLDDFTGNFGGEIRFGWYFDGSNLIPISGGSVQGNIKQLQNDLYFSKEKTEINNYYGPKSIKIKNVSVAGNE